MTALEVELEACGGPTAPASAVARLREVLAEALRNGRAELAKPRSGKDEPVQVAIAAQTGSLLAAIPVAAALRADPDILAEREWLLVAAVVGTLVELAEPGPPFGPDDLKLRAGRAPRRLPRPRLRLRASFDAELVSARASRSTPRPSTGCGHARSPSRRA